MVNSFDQTVGIIGGYAGLIWMTVSFFIGGYQQFKMDSSIAKTLYTRQDEHPPEARSEEEMLDDHYLVGKINGRIKYEYTYQESTWTWFMTKLCCCLASK